MRIQTELERRLKVRLRAARFWAFGFGASVQMKQAAQQFQSGQQVRVARNAGVTAQTTNDPFGGLEIFVRPCQPSSLQFGQRPQVLQVLRLNQFNRPFQEGIRLRLAALLLAHERPDQQAMRPQRVAGQ